MAWFKVDDKLHDHRKARKAGKAAMGVWVLAGSWAMDNESDGFVPADVLLRWGSRADAAKLVSADLWSAAEKEGESGWLFHDWTHFQPSAAVTAAKKAAEHEAGLRGNHNRWHAKRGISDPDCEYCYRVPDGESDQDPEDAPESGPTSGNDRGLGESAPIPPVPVPEPLGDSDESPTRRADVERLCDLLADCIEANGIKRPTITKRWRDAARLAMDADDFTEKQLDWLIRQATSDEFWRANILSMPKLREKAPQLKLKFTSTLAAVPTADPDDPADLPPVEQSWMRRRPNRG